MIYLLLYVYDILFASKYFRDLMHFKQLLKTKFEMKDLGKENKIIRMKISRNKKEGELIVSRYIFYK